MKRPYLSVTPGEDPVIPGDIPETVASLSKLTRTTSTSLLRRLNPFHRQSPLRFEFVALSAGADEPVEFYYGADDHLDALEQRLRSIYPPSYDIERVEIDLVKRLVRPVEFSREEFTERLEDDRLYHEMEQSADGRAAVTDGGEVAVASDATDAEIEPSETTNPSEESDIVLDDIDLAAPRAVDDDETLTVLEGPTETADGTILARPPLAEVEPYGVEWWGAAARRKDWMTTLTGFTEVLNQGRRSADGITNQSRLPLTPLVKQLAEADQPIAFQVVFQGRSDWSRDARRRAGALLNGTDTLLQKLLSLESPGSRRRHSGRRNPQGETRHASRRSTQRRTRSSTGDGPSRPTNVEGASRFDQVRQNSPKRTFSVNLQLFTLAVDGDEPEDLAATLDPLCSVFDLVDGQFYEIVGRRLRSNGLLPGSGRRHARAVFDRFVSRSVATGGRRVSITNRSETRPDLLLNGNELANFLVIPSAADIPAPDSRDEGASEEEADEHPEKTTTDPALPSREASAGGADGAPFSTIPETVVHRDAQISQLSDLLEPIVHGERSDAVFVTGPTGSGKTCTTKFSINRIRQDHPDFDAVYVNCWEDHSRFQVLYRILNEIDSTVDIHRQGTPRDILLDRLREYGQGPCVVVLDEVDHLEDKNLLYELLNMPSFSLLLIVNQEEDLLDGLDQRLVSRLRGCERVRLDRYTDDQLVDILRELAKRELDIDDIDDTGLERIAEAADGDARVASTTLRIAARRHDSSGEDGISKEVVESALPDARQELLGEHVEGLTEHHHVLLQVIEDQGRIGPGDLYEKYSNSIDEPRSERTVRDYLSELKHDDLIAAEGSTRNRMYRSRLRRQL